MALKSLARLMRKRDADPPSLPPGVRIYVVGDIHGRLDLWTPWPSKSAPTLFPRRQRSRRFPGGYVDRGPASAGVVDRLSRGEIPTPIYALRGNHEDVLLRFSMTGPSSTNGVGLAGSKRCNHMASTWRRRFAPAATTSPKKSPGAHASRAPAVSGGNPLRGEPRRLFLLPRGR